MTKLFLSHIQKDAALARAFESEFKRLGLSTFNPSHEIAAGENWRDAIRSAVKHSDALILIVASPHLSESSWVAYEAGLADALGKRIIVLASRRYSKRELPSDLAAWQIVEFDPDAPKRAAELVAEQLLAAT